MRQPKSKSVNRPTRVLGALALLGVTGLLAAGCGSAAGDRPSPSRPAPVVSTQRQSGRHAAAGPTASRGASVSSSRPGATVKVTRSQYGSVLVDKSGRALYLFTRDRTSVSQCYGACADRWPPFLTGGVPMPGTGAQANLLGRTRRREGSTQVTYHGHPLYYYIGDRRPGQVLCQDVEEFGGRWYVLTRRGSAVL
jgi:predicted lipoprotein with Yx(FWY)xxD motif